MNLKTQEFFQKLADDFVGTMKLVKWMPEPDGSALISAVREFTSTDPPEIYFKIKHVEVAMKNGRPPFSLVQVVQTRKNGKATGPLVYVSPLTSAVIAVALR